MEALLLAKLKLGTVTFHHLKNLANYMDVQEVLRIEAEDLEDSSLKHKWVLNYLVINSTEVPTLKNLEGIY